MASSESISLDVVVVPAIERPLSPSSLEWLTPVSIPIHVRLADHSEDLVHLKGC